MHKIIEHICDEIDELERKVDKEGRLSMQELEYLDKLSRVKKNLLKGEMLYEEDEYSNMDGGSYARGRVGNVRRDAMGRYSRRMRGDGYSRAEDDFRMDLQALIKDAPNDHTRQRLQALVNEM